MCLFYILCCLINVHTIINHLMPVFTHPALWLSYLTRAWRKGGNWRDIQNLQVVHNTVKNGRGSVHVSRMGWIVSLREVIVNKLTDDRSFPDSRRSDDGDAQRLDHPARIRTRSGLQTTTIDQDTWKTAQQIKTSHINCERASFYVCIAYSTRTHFVDVEINKSCSQILCLLVHFVISFAEIACWQHIRYWMDQQTNFSHCGSCAAFSAFHWGNSPSVLHCIPSIPTHSSGARKRQQYPTLSIWLLSWLCVLFDLEVTIDPFSS